MSIAEATIRDFNAEAELSRRLLEAVPDDQFAWKPHEKSMSLGQLAGHIAEAPSWVMAMGEDNFNWDPENTEYTPFMPTSTDELLETLEQNTDACREFLEGRSDEFMSADWSMTMGEQTLMAGERDAMIRSTILHHIAHHRGQLTVFLRILDVPVPPTYGPTADNPEPMSP